MTRSDVWSQKQIFMFTFRLHAVWRARLGTGEPLGDTGIHRTMVAQIATCMPPGWTSWRPCAAIGRAAPLSPSEHLAKIKANKKHARCFPYNGAGPLSRKPRSRWLGAGGFTVLSPCWQLRKRGGLLIVSRHYHKGLSEGRVKEASMLSLTTRVLTQQYNSIDYTTGLNLGKLSRVQISAEPASPVSQSQPKAPAWLGPAP